MTILTVNEMLGSDGHVYDLVLVSMTLSWLDLTLSLAQFKVI